MNLLKLLPLSFRNKIRQVMIDVSETERQNHELNLLKEKVHHLSIHSENITKLLVDSVKNLESVGKSLESAYTKINSLSEQIKNSKLELENIEKKYNTFLKVYNEYLPETIPINDLSINIKNEFIRRSNITFDFHSEISKNDIMFLNSIYHNNDFYASLDGYYSIGLNGLNTIRRVLSSAKGNDQISGKILDFAGGYGRVTRFLSGYYGKDNIHCSDVKQDAVQFQVKNFGVTGHLSYFNPDDFLIHDKYEVIFAGSLFSHLNESLFVRWLEKLLKLLNSKGILIFSVHDMSMYSSGYSENFKYVENNEDLPFSIIKETIQNVKDYGISFVKEKFVKDTVQNINKDYTCIRYAKSFGGIQDVYVVTNSELAPKIDLNLAEFP